MMKGLIDIGADLPGIAPMLWQEANDLTRQAHDLERSMRQPVMAPEDEERGVPTEAYLEGRDVYIVYSFEDVAFHWEHASGRVFRRFKGTGRESETVHSNRLYMDARMGGRLATREEYARY